MKYKIVDVDYKTDKDFEIMFKKYFEKDLEIKLTEEKFQEVFSQIYKGTKKRGFWLMILYIDEKPVGFINFQVDNPSSDWNEKEGWGFIRELYIVDEFRGNDYGALLVDYAKNRFKLAGPKSMYLTSEKNNKFLLDSGFEETDEIAKNDLYVYKKDVRSIR